jgi:hypothetical protein
VTKGLAIVFVLCACASLALIWLPTYLPMTDLPQHAAQIAVWRDYADPRFGYGEIFEKQYFTPYLLGYSIARVVAAFASTLVAVKVTITLATLGLPLSLVRLNRALGLDPWWSLVGFAMAFGYSFAWGLLNYLVAIPLGVVFLAYAIEYARAPTRRNAIVVAVSTIVLFVAHGLVFALCAGGAVLFILATEPRPRRLVPFAPAIAVAIAWTLFARTVERSAPMPTVYEYSPMRLVRLPALLVGLFADNYALAVGALLVTLMFVGGLRPVRERARLLPLAFFLVVYLALPRDVFDTSLLYTRVAVFAVPFFLVACVEREPLVRPQLLRVAIVALVLGWLGMTGLRFAIFDSEARLVEPLFAKMEPGKRVRGLIFDRATTGYGESSPFLHFPAWYQAQKGGQMDYTFGHTKTALIRYRPGKRPYQNTDRPFWPHLFNPVTESASYDYFLVRADNPIGHMMFSRAPIPIAFEGRSGNWWLYRRVE